MMAYPDARLTTDDSTVYTNVRGVAGLFSAHAVLFIFLGVIHINERGFDSHPKLQIAGGTAMVFLGVAGVASTLAIVARWRRLAKLIYGAVILNLLAFPIGTVLSVYLLRRLPRYLQVLERLEAADAGDPGVLPVADQPDVADFRKRYYRSRRLLYLFAVLMSFSCVGPCAFSTVVPNANVKGILGASGFFLILVCVGGGVLMLSDLTGYRRSLRVGEEAEVMGFLFSFVPEGTEYEHLRRLYFFRQADGHAAWNIISGRVDHAAVTLMDYALIFGSGKRAKIRRQTITMVPDAVPDLPNFALCPRTLLNWETEMVGAEIELVKYPEFTRMFTLHGAADDAVADRIAACFTPEFVQLCLAEKGLVVEVHDGLLLFYRRGKMVPAEQYSGLVTKAFEFVDALAFSS